MYIGVYCIGVYVYIYIYIYIYMCIGGVYCIAYREDILIN